MSLNEAIFNPIILANPDHNETQRKQGGSLIDGQFWHLTATEYQALATLLANPNTSNNTTVINTYVTNGQPTLPYVTAATATWTLAIEGSPWVPLTFSRTQENLTGSPKVYNISKYDKLNINTLVYHVYNGVGNVVSRVDMILPNGTRVIETQLTRDYYKKNVAGDDDHLATVTATTGVVPSGYDYVKVTYTSNTPIAITGDPAVAGPTVRNVRLLLTTTSTTYEQVVTSFIFDFPVGVVAPVALYRWDPNVSADWAPNAYDLFMGNRWVKYTTTVGGNIVTSWYSISKDASKNGIDVYSKFQDAFGTPNHIAHKETGWIVIADNKFLHATSTTNESLVSYAAVTGTTIVPSEITTCGGEYVGATFDSDYAQKNYFAAMNTTTNTMDVDLEKQFVRWSITASVSFDNGITTYDLRPYPYGPILDQEGHGYLIYRLRGSVAPWPVRVYNQLDSSWYSGLESPNGVLSNLVSTTNNVVSGGSTVIPGTVLPAVSYPAHISDPVSDGTNYGYALNLSINGLGTTLGDIHAFSRTIENTIPVIGAELSTITLDAHVADSPSDPIAYTYHRDAGYANIDRKVYTRVFTRDTTTTTEVPSYSASTVWFPKQQVEGFGATTYDGSAIVDIAGTPQLVHAYMGTAPYIHIDKSVVVDAKPNELVYDYSNKRYNFRGMYQSTAPISVLGTDSVTGPTTAMATTLLQVFTYPYSATVDLVLVYAESTTAKRLYAGTMAPLTAAGKPINWVAIATGIANDTWVPDAGGTKCRIVHEAAAPYAPCAIDSATNASAHKYTNYYYYYCIPDNNRWYFNVTDHDGYLAESVYFGKELARAANVTAAIVASNIITSFTNVPLTMGDRNPIITTVTPVSYTDVLINMINLNGAVNNRWFVGIVPSSTPLPEAIADIVDNVSYLRDSSGVVLDNVSLPYKEADSTIQANVTEALVYSVEKDCWYIGSAPQGTALVTIANTALQMNRYLRNTSMTIVRSAVLPWKTPDTIVSVNTTQITRGALYANVTVAAHVSDVPSDTMPYQYNHLFTTNGLGATTGDVHTYGRAYNVTEVQADGVDVPTIYVAGRIGDTPSDTTVYPYNKSLTYTTPDYKVYSRAFTQVTSMVLETVTEIPTISVASHIHDSPSDATVYTYTKSNTYSTTTYRYFSRSFANYIQTLTDAVGKLTTNPLPNQWTTFTPNALLYGATTPVAINGRTLTSYMYYTAATTDGVRSTQGGFVTTGDVYTVRMPLETTYDFSNKTFVWRGNYSIPHLAAATCPNGPTTQVMGTTPTGTGQVFSYRFSSTVDLVIVRPDDAIKPWYAGVMTVKSYAGVPGDWNLQIINTLTDTWGSTTKNGATVEPFQAVRVLYNVADDTVVAGAGNAGDFAHVFYYIREYDRWYYHRTTATLFLANELGAGAGPIAERQSVIQSLVAANAPLAQFDGVTLFRNSTLKCLQSELVTISVASHIRDTPSDRAVYSYTRSTANSTPLKKFYWRQTTGTISTPVNTTTEKSSIAVAAHIYDSPADTTVYTYTKDATLSDTTRKYFYRNYTSTVASYSPASTLTKNPFPKQWAPTAVPVMQWHRSGSTASTVTVNSVPLTVQTYYMTTTGGHIDTGTVTTYRKPGETVYDFSNKKFLFRGNYSIAGLVGATDTNLTAASMPQVSGSPNCTYGHVFTCNYSPTVDLAIVVPSSGSGTSDGPWYAGTMAPLANATALPADWTTAITSIVSDTWTDTVKRCRVLYSSSGVPVAGNRGSYLTDYYMFYYVTQHNRWYYRETNNAGWYSETLGGVAPSTLGGLITASQWLVNFDGTPATSTNIPYLVAYYESMRDVAVYSIAADRWFVEQIVRSTATNYYSTAATTLLAGTKYMRNVSGTILTDTTLPTTTTTTTYTTTPVNYDEILVNNAIDEVWYLDKVVTDGTTPNYYTDAATTAITNNRTLNDINSNMMAIAQLPYALAEVSTISIAGHVADTPTDPTVYNYTRQDAYTTDDKKFYWRKFSKTASQGVATTSELATVQVRAHVHDSPSDSTLYTYTKSDALTTATLKYFSRDLTKTIDVPTAQVTQKETIAVAAHIYDTIPDTNVYSYTKDNTYSTVDKKFFTRAYATTQTSAVAMVDIVMYDAVTDKWYVDTVAASSATGYYDTVMQNMVSGNKLLLDASGNPVSLNADKTYLSSMMVDAHISDAIVDTSQYPYFDSTALPTVGHVITSTLPNKRVYSRARTGWTNYAYTPASTLTTWFDNGMGARSGLFDTPYSVSATVNGASTSVTAWKLNNDIYVGARVTTPSVYTSVPPTALQESYMKPSTYDYSNKTYRYLRTIVADLGCLPAIADAGPTTVPAIGTGVTALTYDVYGYRTEGAIMQCLIFGTYVTNLGQNYATPVYAATAQLPDDFGAWTGTGALTSSQAEIAIITDSWLDGSIRRNNALYNTSDNTVLMSSALTVVRYTTGIFYVTEQDRWYWAECPHASSTTLTTAVVNAAITAKQRLINIMKSSEIIYREASRNQLSPGTPVTGTQVDNMDLLVYDVATKLWYFDTVLQFTGATPAATTAYYEQKQLEMIAANKYLYLRSGVQATGVTLCCHRQPVSTVYCATHAHDTPSDTSTYTYNYTTDNIVGSSVRYDSNLIIYRRTTSASVATQLPVGTVTYWPYSTDASLQTGKTYYRLNRAYRPMVVSGTTYNALLYARIADTEYSGYVTTPSIVWDATTGQSAAETAASNLRYGYVGQITVATAFTTPTPNNTTITVGSKINVYRHRTAAGVLHYLVSLATPTGKWYYQTFAAGTVVTQQMLLNIMTTKTGTYDQCIANSATSGTVLTNTTLSPVITVLSTAPGCHLLWYVAETNSWYHRTYSGVQTTYLFGDNYILADVFNGSMGSGPLSWNKLQIAFADCITGASTDTTLTNNYSSCVYATTGPRYAVSQTGAQLLGTNAVASGMYSSLLVPTLLFTQPQVHELLIYNQSNKHWYLVTFQANSNSADPSKWNQLVYEKVKTAIDGDMYLLSLGGSPVTNAQLPCRDTMSKAVAAHVHDSPSVPTVFTYNFSDAMSVGIGCAYIRNTSVSTTVTTPYADTLMMKASSGAWYVDLSNDQLLDSGTTATHYTNAETRMLAGNTYLKDVNGTILTDTTLPSFTTTTINVPTSTAFKDILVLDTGTASKYWYNSTVQASNAVGYYSNTRDSMLTGNLYLRDINGNIVTESVLPSTVTTISTVSVTTDYTDMLIYYNQNWYINIVPDSAIDGYYAAARDAAITSNKYLYNSAGNRVTYTTLSTTASMNFDDILVYDNATNKWYATVVPTSTALGYYPAVAAAMIAERRFLYNNAGSTLSNTELPAFSVTTNTVTGNVSKTDLVVYSLARDKWYTNLVNTPLTSDDYQTVVADMFNTNKYLCNAGGVTYTSATLPFATAELDTIAFATHLHDTPPVATTFVYDKRPNYSTGTLKFYSRDYEVVDSATDSTGALTSVVVQSHLTDAPSDPMFYTYSKVPALSTVDKQYYARSLMKTVTSTVNSGQTSYWLQVINPTPKQCVETNECLSSFGWANSSYPNGFPVAINQNTSVTVIPFTTTDVGSTIVTGTVTTNIKPGETAYDYSDKTFAFRGYISYTGEGADMLGTSEFGPTSIPEPNTASNKFSVYTCNVSPTVDLVLVGGSYIGKSPATPVNTVLYAGTMHPLTAPGQPANWDTVIRAIMTDAWVDADNGDTLCRALYDDNSDPVVYDATTMITRGIAYYVKETDRWHHAPITYAQWQTVNGSYSTPATVATVTAVVLGSIGGSVMEDFFDVPYTNATLPAYMAVEATTTTSSVNYEDILVLYGNNWYNNTVVSSGVPGYYEAVRDSMIANVKYLRKPNGSIVTASDVPATAATTTYTRRNYTEILLFNTVNNRWYIDTVTASTAANYYPTAATTMVTYNKYLLDAVGGNVTNIQLPYITTAFITSDPRIEVLVYSVTNDQWYMNNGSAATSALSLASVAITTPLYLYNATGNRVTKDQLAYKSADITTTIPGSQVVQDITPYSINAGTGIIAIAIPHEATYRKFKLIAPNGMDVTSQLNRPEGRVGTDLDVSASTVPSTPYDIYVLTDVVFAGMYGVWSLKYV